MCIKNSMHMIKSKYAIPSAFAQSNLANFIYLVKYAYIQMCLREP